MHILVPTGIFHPEAGGPATYLYHFLPELQARGHTVEVITFSDDAPSTAYPYPVRRIPRTHLLHRNWVYHQAVKERLPQADLVYVNGLGLWLPTFKQPSIIKIVGDRAWERSMNRGWIAPDEDIDRFQLRRYSPLIQWIKRGRTKEAQAVDRVIVPSHYLKRMVIGWGVRSERIEVIYNAFEAASDSGPKVSRAELGLPTDQPLLLMVARLTAWKGLDALLKALTDLPAIHLVVAGDGPMLMAWQALASQLGLAERVRFLGDLPRQQVQAYYQAADYTVLYSGYEGLSHVLLESLSVGTPVIASAKGGNPEVVKHGENGLLVPYKNVEALRQALHQAFEGDTPQRLRAGAHLEAERFRWSGLVEKTIALLERTAQGQ
jgi:glycosyltransferase involved in cell wall biosynthesis